MLDLVLYVLENYEDTRSNDNKLLCKICELMGIEKVKDLYSSNISIITIHKARQKIQNKLGLFNPDESVMSERRKISNRLKKEIFNNKN
jgi:hypothetical protein